MRGIGRTGEQQRCAQGYIGVGGRRRKEGHLGARRLAEWCLGVDRVGDREQHGI